MTNRPRQLFYKPILTALREMGGIGISAEIVLRVIEACGGVADKITAPELQKIRKRIDWARYDLVAAGYLQSPSRGIWEITDKGQRVDLNSFVEEEVKQEAWKVHKSPGRTSPDSDAESVAAPDVDEFVSETPEWERRREALLSRLLDLSPTQFERVCRHLLMRVGFEDVQVTRQTNDGGFDGVGLLVVNPFVKTSFLFECKRYTSALVGVKDVRALQGKIYQGAAEKGAIITTSYFTSDARKEAHKPSGRIELVERDELIDLFVAHRVGVRVAERIDEIDDGFFQRYKESA